MPKAYSFGVSKGSRYDLFIAGWVKYWSDIFGKNTKITPDFVKTLMMTESTFRERVTATTHDRPGKAMGLMQITDYTFKLAQANSKELRNHAFRLHKDSAFDPNVNICLGVRWLFRKREIAKYFLKKEPSGLQLAEEYKGIRGDKSKKAIDQRKAFLKQQKRYQNAKPN